MRTRLLPVVLAALAVTALAACDPSAIGGATSAPPDPCLLVTADDLTQQLGEDFLADTAPPTGATQRVCGYTATETGHHVDVTVYADVAGYQDLVNHADTAGETPAPVTGVGRAAVRTHTELLAVFDSFVLTVVLTGIPAGDGVDAALEALGHLASDRVSGVSPTPSPETPAASLSPSAS
jgi:hypothetical protein